MKRAFVLLLSAAAAVHAEYALGAARFSSFPRPVGLRAGRLLLP
jgi:hypothetical protein